MDSANQVLEKAANILNGLPLLQSTLLQLTYHIDAMLREHITLNVTSAIQAESNIRAMSRVIERFAPNLGE